MKCSVVIIATLVVALAVPVSAQSLEFTFNGPNSFIPVNSDSQGPNGDGHILASVIVTAHGDTWTVNDITFSAAGSADEQAGLSFLALYVDDGNGTFDGPTTDTLATASPGVSFDAPDGDYTAALTGGAGDFAVDESKTYFLVGKLSGTAVMDERFRANVTGVTESSPGGGPVTGIPTPLTSALVVDVASMSVTAGPGNPASMKYEAPGVAHSALLAQFRFSAMNGDFEVAGINLSTGGGGDWVNNLDAASGVELYHDDGDGTFDDTSDILLFSGPGNTPSMSAAFVSNLVVNSGESEDVWMALNFTSTAGGSPSEQFEAGIAAAGDVLTAVAPGNVSLGTPHPESGTIDIVFFQVTSFSPLSGAESGGASITIDGSGFGPSPSVWIDGILCPGSPVVNTGGNQITGLVVPPGTGSNLPIEIETNELGVKTLSQTFTYNPPGGGNGDDDDDEDEYCSTVAGGESFLLAGILAVLALTLYRRQRA